MKRMHFWGILLAVSSFGCEQGASTVWWEGQYLRYTMSDDLIPCGGTYELVDSFVPFISDELGIKSPKDIEYSWLNAKEFEASSCPDDSGGCAKENRTYAQDPVLLHEIVHNVASASGMNGLPFFTEGVAVTYDPFAHGLGPRYIPGFAAPFPDPRLEMTLPATELHYGTASWFVAFLLARHGPEPFVAVSQRSNYGQDMEMIRSNFRAVYGRELDDEVELYRSGTDLGCDEGYFAVRPYDCTMPEIAWSGGQWAYERIMDCSAEDVAGGIGSDRSWFSTHSVTFEVPETGFFSLKIHSDESASMQIGRCFGCPWQHNDVMLSRTDPSTSTTLEAGTYFVRFNTDSVETARVGAVITPS